MSLAKKGKERHTSTETKEFFKQTSKSQHDLNQEILNPPSSHQLKSQLNNSLKSLIPWQCS